MSIWVVRIQIPIRQIGIPVRSASPTRAKHRLVGRSKIAEGKPTNRRVSQHLLPALWIWAIVQPMGLCFVKVSFHLGFKAKDEHLPFKALLFCFGPNPHLASFGCFLLIPLSHRIRGPIPVLTSTHHVDPKTTWQKHTL